MSPFTRISGQYPDHLPNVAGEVVGVDTVREEERARQVVFVSVAVIGVCSFGNGFHPRQAKPLS